MPTTGYIQNMTPPPQITTSGTPPPNPNIGDLWIQTFTGPITATTGSGWTHTTTTIYQRDPTKWATTGPSHTQLNGLTSTNGQALLDLTPINYLTAPLVTFSVAGAPINTTACFANNLGTTLTSLQLQVWEGAPITILGGFPLRAPSGPGGTKNVTAFLWGTVMNV